MKELKDIRKILLITLTNIGDAVLTLPVALVLKEKFPSAYLDVLLGPKPYELFRNIPYFSKVIPYDKRMPCFRKIRLILKLRRERYDLVVDLRHSLFPLFLKPRYSTPLLFKVSKEIKHKQDFHLYKLKLAGVDFVGFSSDNPFGINFNEGRKIDDLLISKGIYSEDKLIVLAPSARDRGKRWGAQNFARLSDALSREGKVVLVGSKEDKEVIEEVLFFSKSKPLRLDGELDLRDLVVLLKRADLFIGNDSAPMQIASLLGIPTIGIFGPTEVEKYKPLGDRSRAIRKGRSVDLVLPEEVLKLAKELIRDEQEKIDRTN